MRESNMFLQQTHVDLSRVQVGLYRTYGVGFENQFSQFSSRYETHVENEFLPLFSEEYQQQSALRDMVSSTLTFARSFAMLTETARLDQ